MDFVGQYNFADPQPYRHFMPIPPLTPSHSHSSSTDDFNTSPPVSNCPPPQSLPLPRGNPADQSQSFDCTSAQGLRVNSRQPISGFPVPPTLSIQNDFASQVQVHQQKGGAVRDGSPDGQSVVGGASKEDENSTPAQSRRKSQNRAAQRAFRERKAKHVEDLEAKLAGLEAAQQQLSLENKRLKRDLQKISTENEILRARLHMSHSSISLEPVTGLLHLKPTEFYADDLQKHANKFASHRIVSSDDGERLLAVGATWDFIISHELFKKGLVDIADVSERLRNHAQCNGQGPVFSQRSILNAVEQTVASGTDDLL